MRLLALVIGLCITASAVYATFQMGLPPEMAFEGSSAISFLSVSMVAALMLVGLAFGCLFRQVTGRADPINVVVELRRMLTSSSFLSALCVAPFVFMSVFAVVKASPGDPASLLLAFQNGFFCESVFSRLFAHEGRAQDKSSTGKAT